MNDFKALCSSDYGKVDLDLELVKLTVIVRNGERSPKIDTKSHWNNRMCIKCPRNVCTMSPCRDEMLTVKGYHQGHLLANFIKDQYYPKFSKKNTVESKDMPQNKNKRRIFWYNDNQALPENQNDEKYSSSPYFQSAMPLTSSPYGFNRIISSYSILEPETTPSIKGYFYINPKHHVFLKSIVETLHYSNLTLKKIKPLTCTDECQKLRDSLYSKGKQPKHSFAAEFEQIISSLCTDVPIDCSKFDCDLEKMDDFLIQEKLDFEDSLAKMREEITAVSVDFSQMAAFLILALDEPEDIQLVSVDNQSITTLLAGLNTSNNKPISYGAAVFIELWKNKGQEEFYSVLYNGKRMKFGLFKEAFVKKTEFMKYLKMFSNYSNQIKQICNEQIKDLNEKDLLDLKTAQVKNVLEPFIEKLKKSRVLVK